VELVDQVVGQQRVQELAVAIGEDVLAGLLSLAKTSPLVQPLIMPVYVGIAESARPLALAHAAKKRDDPIAQGLVGEMDTHLAAAQVALREMVALGSD